MNFQNGNSVNVKNFIDFSLFLQILSGIDNYGYKNTFYALKENEEVHELCFVPWDTDLSLGVTWGYDYDKSLSQIIERYEMETMKQKVPKLDNAILERRKELRKTVYSEENVMAIYYDCCSKLFESGAVKRDKEQ